MRRDDVYVIIRGGRLWLVMVMVMVIVVRRVELELEHLRLLNGRNRRGELCVRLHDSIFLCG